MIDQIIGPSPYCRSSHVIVVVVCFVLSRLLYLDYSANLGLLCMPHPGFSLTSLPKDGGVSCFGRSSGGRPSSSDRTQPCLTSVKLIELAVPLGHSPHLATSDVQPITGTSI